MDSSLNIKFLKNFKVEGMVHFDIYHFYFWGLSQNVKIVWAAENPTFSNLKKKVWLDLKCFRMQWYWLIFHKMKLGQLSVPSISSEVLEWVHCYKIMDDLSNSFIEKEFLFNGVRKESGCIKKNKIGNNWGQGVVHKIR